MYEWLICIKYDVYHSVVDFLLYLNDEIFYGVLICIDVDIVGECMYVDDVVELLLNMCMVCHMFIHS